MRGPRNKDPVFFIALISVLCLINAHFYNLICQINHNFLY